MTALNLSLNGQRTGEWKGRTKNKIKVKVKENINHADSSLEIKSKFTRSQMQNKTERVGLEERKIEEVLV